MDAVKGTTKRASQSVADSVPSLEVAEVETITERNQKAELLLGWTKRELVGRKLSEVVIAPCDRDAYEVWKKEYLAGQVPRPCPLREFAALRNEQGEVSGLLGIFADITDRKRMEQELAKAKEAAEAAAKAKRECPDSSVSCRLRWSTW